MAVTKTIEGFKYKTRKGLTLFPLEGLSISRWLELRQMGGALGGSDVGSIMGWNKRFSPIELFYQKVGVTFSNVNDLNEFTAWGHLHEKNILKIGQFFDHEKQDYLINYEDGNMLRTITAFPFSVRNPRYPWANANVDGLIDYNNKTFKARRIAESKATSRQASEMWETIPPYHIGQVMLYMAICEPMLSEQVAEIYYLTDGNKFTGWEIEQRPSLMLEIEEKCIDFHSRITKGIEIMKNERNPQLQEMALQELEPEPDNTLAYEKFLSEKFKKKSMYTQVTGTNELLERALEYKFISKTIKTLTEEKQEKKNIIWNYLCRNSANVVTFGKGQGKITFADKLYVNVKEG